MSASKTEIGINIVQCKESGNYYQSTDEYTFFSNTHCFSRLRISWLPIVDEHAIAIIENLRLERTESELFVTWACKQQLKANSHLEKGVGKMIPPK